MNARPLVVVLVAGLATSGAGAQTPARTTGTVTGQGHVDLKRQPDLLRVQVEILGKGKDLTEALARLKERRDAARSRLETLGVGKEAVVFGEPSLGAEKTEQQKQMEAMVARQLRATGARTGARPKQPAPTVVSLWLQFHVPLKASDTEELLLVSHKLQEQIREADLAGLKELEKQAPEDPEAAEEAQLAQSMGFDPGPKRGEPTFAFVRKISEDDLARALSGAFDKARKEATRLARAAGAELGELHHLDQRNVTASPDDGTYGGPVYYARMPSQNRVVPNLPAPQGAEAVGSQPGPVTYRVTVNAAFLLKGSGR
jgi:uncharacterized protein YggE